MFIDAHDLQPDTTLSTDIVVVGAGLAGLSLASALYGSGLSVVLVESGGRTAAPETEALNYGRASLHDPYGNHRNYDAFLHESRCRYLGGAGNLWGGKCAEPDPIDFEWRRWIEHSGWPYPYEKLKPYLDRACEQLQLPPFQRQIPLRSDDPRPPLIVNRERTLTTGLRRYTAIAGRASPQRYAEFIDQVCHYPQVTTVLHATATRLFTRTQPDRVDGIQCQTITGKSFSIRAQACVLAAGGLENPRLMLHSNQPWANGIGNDHDLVGRYFMGHVIHRHTNIHSQPFTFHPRLPPQQLRLYLDKDPTQLQGVLQLTRHTQRRERLPNCSLTLTPDDHATTTTAYLMVEPVPNPHSRLRLQSANDAAATVDAMQVPRIQLDWCFQDQDIEALQRAAATFATELVTHGVGELRYTIDPQQFIQQLDCARHHMGTTRMHTNPNHGVVDEHGRVHGIANLFVTGASTFPAAGIANPTLAIMGLALKLGDHLKTQPWL